MLAPRTLAPTAQNWIEEAGVFFYTELSQLLLCDLTLHFSHPVKTDDLKETERNSPYLEESKVPDVSLASDSFLI